MGLFDLFGKKSAPEDSLPLTESEKWIVATYAIWSEFSNGSWKFIGGFEKNRSNASMARGVLNRDWMVSNVESGKDMVKYLIDNAGKAAAEDGEEKQLRAKKKLAFDYACACNMCGRMYLGGLMERAESMNLAKEAAKKIQQVYGSWEEYGAAYVEGAKLELGCDEGDSCAKQLDDIFAKLSGMAEGPYTVAWNTTL